MSDPCKLPNSSFKESCNFSITTGHTHLRLWQLKQHEGWLLCLSFHYASCSMLNVYHPLLHLRVLLLLWEELRKCKCVMFQGLLATTCYSCAVKWVSCRRLPRSKAQNYEDVVKGDVALRTPDWLLRSVSPVFILLLSFLPVPALIMLSYISM